MNTLSSILNNIEQKISTPAGLTRATAGILAIPAIYISPKLLMMPHPITCYVVGINFASIFTALIYGEQTYLTPSLYITGGLIGFEIFLRKMTNDFDNVCKKAKKN